jgi:hypothetical protein
VILQQIIPEIELVPTMKANVYLWSMLNPRAFFHERFLEEIPIVEA